MKKKIIILSVLLSSFITFFTNYKILLNDDLIFDSFKTFFGTNSYIFISLTFLVLNIFLLLLFLLLLVLIINNNFFFKSKKRLLIHFFLLFIVLFLFFLKLYKTVESVLMVYLDLFYMCVFSFWIFCITNLLLIMLFEKSKKK